MTIAKSFNSMAVLASAPKPSRRMPVRVELWRVSNLAERIQIVIVCHDTNDKTIVPEDSSGQNEYASRMIGYRRPTINRAELDSYQNIAALRSV